MLCLTFLFFYFYVLAMLKGVSSDLLTLILIDSCFWWNIIIIYLSDWYLRPAHFQPLPCWFLYSRQGPYYFNYFIKDGGGWCRRGMQDSPILILHKLINQFKYKTIDKLFKTFLSCTFERSAQLERWEPLQIRLINIHVFLTMGRNKNIYLNSIFF